jgi:MFS family permease
MKTWLHNQLHNRLDGLWRHRDFRKLWLSLTITHFGGQVTFLALPLTAALMLNASPLEMGILTALEALPFALFGIFAGVLVDRSPKLKLIVWSDIGRGLALLAVPICAWLGWLSMPVLYAVGFLVGLGSIIGWPAYQVFMTERVGRENLVEANAKMGVSDSAAQLIGPGMAGALIQWLTAPFAILLDALCFFFSAWILRGIPPAESDKPKMTARSIWAEMREGLVTIWNSPVLRALAWAIAIWQFLRHAYVAIVILFATRELNFSAGHVGVLWMAAGIGAFVAAAVTGKFNARFGMGRTMLVSLTGTGAAWVLVACSTGSELMASLLFGGGIFLLDLTAMIFFINYLTIRQAVTPDALLGRVVATMIGITISTAPLGGIAGGWLAEHIGLRETLLLTGVTALLLAIPVAWFSPLWHMHDLPKPAEPRLVGSLTEEMAGD